MRRSARARLEERRPILQVQVLNRAMKLMDNSILIPFQYIQFTFLSSLSTLLVYEDIALTWSHSLLILLNGCLFSVIGVYLLAGRRLP